MPAPPLTVDRLTWRGHGLAIQEGEARVLPGTLPGETVRTDEDGHAEILDPHPERIDPACDQAHNCPGCPLRHLSTRGQADLKAASHRAALRRIAGVELPGAVVARAPTDAYRDRAVARPYLEDGRLRLGLRGHDGAGVDLARCPAQTPRTAALLAQVADVLHARGVRPYDPDTGDGALHHVVVHGADRVVVGLTDDAARPALDGLLVDRPDVALLVERVSTARPRILARPERLRGAASAEITVDGDRLRATLPAWTPQSPSTLCALRARVLLHLRPRPADVVLEIGCGIGTMTLAIARQVGRVLGVDHDRAATIDAAHNAARAGLENIEVRAGDGEKTVRRLLGGGFRADQVVLHAMRRPYGAGLMRILPALGMRRVVYLAPSAPSLARDLVALKGWSARRLDFVDQMPGTAWLLSVCTIERDV